MTSHQYASLICPLQPLKQVDHKHPNISPLSWPAMLLAEQLHTRTLHTLGVPIPQFNRRAGQQPTFSCPITSVRSQGYCFCLLPAHLGASGSSTSSTRASDRVGISMRASWRWPLCAASCAGVMPYRLGMLRGSSGRGAPEGEPISCSTCKEKSTCSQHQQGLDPPFQVATQ